LFLRNPRVVLTRSRIFEEVWGYDFGASSNALEVYVSHLRRKLEAEGEPRLIHTVRGVGYTLREPELPGSPDAGGSGGGGGCHPGRGGGRLLRRSEPADGAHR